MHCRALKNFLNEHNIEYDFIDVDKLDGNDREHVLSEVMKVSGNMRFPTIVIGDKVIIGFYEDKVREALGL